MAKISRDQIFLRTIESKDNPGISKVIHRVLEVYGGNREGFAGSDWATENMFDYYQKMNGCYYVIEHDGEIKGGGGISQLEGGEAGWCELQKMYFLPEVRGLGLSKEIMDLCLNDARQLGFHSVYLETLNNMDVAQKLYGKYGFQKLDAPKGNTGHFGCNVWMFKSINQ